MAVKRLTIELDDITDASNPTSSPSTLMLWQTLSVRKEQTDLPAKQSDYQESDVSPSPESAKASEIVGRTPADLVYAFMNRPEFMVTLFVFLAFLVSVPRLQKVSDLWITSAIALALNVVWFGIMGVRMLFARRMKY